jgi:hypothetical protein
VSNQRTFAAGVMELGNCPATGVSAREVACSAQVCINDDSDAGPGTNDRVGVPSTHQASAEYQRAQWFGRFHQKAGRLNNGDRAAADGGTYLPLAASDDID